MRHIYLTCKNHPELRWSTKFIAVNTDGSYNGQRNIFFLGTWTGTDEQWMEHVTRGKYHSACLTEPFVECSCKSSELTFAPGEVKTEEEDKY